MGVDAVGRADMAAALSAGGDALLAGAQAGAGSGEEKKIAKAGRDFESLLLSSWLGKAEASFGSVPGGEDDEDSGKQQYDGIAMQALGGALADEGGIGIGQMIVSHLQQSARGDDVKAVSNQGTGTDSTEERQRNR